MKKFSKDQKNIMITYKAKFVGRTVGAIGIKYEITTTVTAENKEAAHLALYDRFDHISCLQLEPIDQAACEKNLKG